MELRTLSDGCCQRVSLWAGSHAHACMHLLGWNESKSDSRDPAESAAACCQRHDDGGLTAVVSVQRRPVCRHLNSFLALAVFMWGLFTAAFAVFKRVFVHRCCSCECSAKAA